MLQPDAIWLRYQFQGFTFEFVRDVIIVTDIVFRKKWKIIVIPHPDNPFHIMLMERE
jgi:hypothetical protein